MSAQVCPVCGGKGLVPNGFYDVGSTNLSDTYKTTSATPETCRSCGGKGYIIEYPDSCQIPVYNTFKSCSICNRNDGVCYMSNPPKYRCILDGEYHAADYSCDKFDDTSIYGTIKGKVVENYDIKLNSTSATCNTIKVDNEESIETHCNRGCSTCTNSDGHVYVQSYYGLHEEVKYRCSLDGNLHSANHSCENYNYIKYLDK